MASITVHQAESDSVHSCRANQTPRLPVPAIKLKTRIHFAWQPLRASSLGTAREPSSSFSPPRFADTLAGASTRVTKSRNASRYSRAATSGIPLPKPTMVPRGVRGAAPAPNELHTHVRRVLDEFHPTRFFRTEHSTLALVHLTVVSRFSSGYSRASDRGRLPTPFHVRVPPCASTTRRATR